MTGEEHKLILTLIPKFEKGAIDDAIRTASGFRNEKEQDEADDKSSHVRRDEDHENDDRERFSKVDPKETDHNRNNRSDDRAQLRDVFKSFFTKYNHFSRDKERGPEDESAKGEYDKISSSLMAIFKPIFTRFSHFSRDKERGPEDESAKGEYDKISSSLMAIFKPIFTRFSHFSRDKERKPEDEPQDNNHDKFFKHFEGIMSKLLPHRKEKEEEDPQKAHAKDELKKKVLTSSISGATRGIKAIMTTSLGFVEDIYKRMKQASPLLQAVESMFNLAVRLFFMPLGNKLAEIMIPATIQLLDEVTKIWGSFEGQSLGQMLTTAISKGVMMFGNYISSLGELLKNETGVVGAIGRFLVKIGDFVENKLETIINVILNTASLIMDHFLEFVAIYVGTQTALIGAVIGGSGLLGPVGAAAGAAAGFAVGAGATEAVGRGVLGFAEGGHVPAKDGGHLAVIGEGGEGEWIIPDSKMGSLGGNNITNNFYISGVTSEELCTMIEDKINDQISLSRIRGAF